MLINVVIRQLINADPIAADYGPVPPDHGTPPFPGFSDVARALLSIMLGLIQRAQGIKH